MASISHWSHFHCVLRLNAREANSAPYYPQELLFSFWEATNKKKLAKFFSLSTFYPFVFLLRHKDNTKLSSLFSMLLIYLLNSYLLMLHIREKTGFVFSHAGFFSSVFTYFLRYLHLFANSFFVCYFGAFVICDSVLWDDREINLQISCKLKS